MSHLSATVIGFTIGTLTAALLGWNIQAGIGMIVGAVYYHALLKYHKVV